MLNRLAILFFEFLIWAKGYRIKRVLSDKDRRDLKALIQEVHDLEKGWILPEECQNWAKKNYQKAISFIVYRKEKPVGTVTLFDPRYANRLYEGYGINENNECFEMGGLAVKKEYRGKNMFVFFILMKAIYVYSISNKINYWLAISTERLFNRISQFGNPPSLLEVSTENGKTKEGIMYCDISKVFSPTLVCYKMEVSSFTPSKLVVPFIKRLWKRG